jgi:hypothetical protein
VILKIVTVMVHQHGKLIYFLKINYFLTCFPKTQGLNGFKTLFPQNYDFQNYFAKIEGCNPWESFPK